MAWDDTPPTPQDLASNPMSGGGGWDTAPPTAKELGDQVGTTPPDVAMKQDMYGPGLQDATVNDGMMWDGITEAPFLAKNVAGIAAKGVGAALDAIPATENFLPTIQRVANNQTLKSFGGSQGQLRQMAAGRGGRQALDDAAQFARDKGLADVWSTSIGREKQLEALKDASGSKIGALRQEAGAAPSDTINQVVKSPKIDPYLGNGSSGRELGGVDRALNDIKEIGGDNPTHASLADAATHINKNAAGAKLYQPVNAETDVANILSNLNNQGIAQSLGSDKAKQYIEALSDQQKLHPLEHLQERGEMRQAGGRGALGGVGQEIKDRFGYRSAAKTMSNLHDALKGGPLSDYVARAGQSGIRVSPAMAAYIKSKSKEQNED